MRELKRDKENKAQALADNKQIIYYRARKCVCMPQADVGINAAHGKRMLDY